MFILYYKKQFNCIKIVFYKGIDTIMINTKDMDTILSNFVHSDNNDDDLKITTELIKRIKKNISEASEHIETFIDNEIDFIKEFIYKIDSETLDKIYFAAEDKTYYGSDIQVIIYELYIDILSTMDCSNCSLTNEQIKNNSDELLNHILKNGSEEVSKITKILELSSIYKECSKNKNVRKMVYSFLRKYINTQTNSILVSELYKSYISELDGFGASYYDSYEDNGEEEYTEDDNDVLSMQKYKNKLTKSNNDYYDYYDIYDDYGYGYGYGYSNYGYGGYGRYTKGKSNSWSYTPYTPKPDYTVEENGKPLEFDGQKEFEEILKMDQTQLKSYLSNYLSSCGYEVNEGSGYLYAKGTEKVLLTAHMDRHPSQDKVVEEIKELKTNLGTVWTSPQGICGDDRCGVWAIMQIIKTKHPSVLFCEDEETGCKGSTAFAATDYCKNLDINYMVQIDRRGSNDLVFYSCENKDFENWLVEKTGYATARGSYTDIAVLMPVSGIAGVNFSSGYYHEHNKSEYIIIEQIIRTKDTVDKLLDEEVKEPFKYVAKENYWDKHSKKNSNSTSTVYTYSNSNNTSSDKKLSYAEKYLNKKTDNRDSSTVTFNYYKNFIGKTLKEFNETLTVPKKTRIMVYKNLDKGAVLNQGEYNYNSIKTINKKLQDNIIYDINRTGYMLYIYVCTKSIYDKMYSKSPFQKKLFDWGK